MRSVGVIWKLSGRWILQAGTQIRSAALSVVCSPVSYAKPFESVCSPLSRAALSVTSLRPGAGILGGGLQGAVVRAANMQT